MTPEETRQRLDEAVRAHASHELEADGEVIVSWIMLAAVRRYDGGGAVIHMTHDDAMPFWEARGILYETLASIDREAAAEYGGNDE